jgi:hypothetical protein
MGEERQLSNHRSLMYIREALGRSNVHTKDTGQKRRRITQISKIRKKR